MVSVSWGERRCAIDPIDLLSAFLATDELEQRLLEASRVPGRWAAGPVLDDLAGRARAQAGELLCLAWESPTTAGTFRPRARVTLRLMELGCRLRRPELLAQLRDDEGRLLVALQASAVEALLERPVPAPRKDDASASNRKPRTVRSPGGPRSKSRRAKGAVELRRAARRRAG